jgi:Rod binding domain-containing protein
MKIEGVVSSSIPGKGKIQEHTQLVHAAQEFEAMLLQELLKPLQTAENRYEDRDSDHAADTLSSFGTEAVASAISKHGGLGIAKRVVEQVTHERP